MIKDAPYLSVLYNKKTDSTTLCLIQLLSKSGVSYYPINEVSQEDLVLFFSLAESWWQKCPLLPISLYYKEQFKKFLYCKKFSFAGDYQIIGGFSGVNLKYLSEKRIKRRLIHIGN